MATRSVYYIPNAGNPTHEEKTVYDGERVFPGKEKALPVIVDPRDQRVLIVFEGDILAGGFPRKAHVLQRSYVKTLTAATGNVYKPRTPTEEPVPYSCDDVLARLLLYRYTVIAPFHPITIRQYDERTLHPRIVMINVTPQKVEKLRVSPS